MSTPRFMLGPVLSFRGCGDDGQWRVTALIGLAADDPVPAFQCDQQACPPPVLLVKNARQQFLRYDLSCALQPQERTVAFGLADGAAGWHFTVPGAGQVPHMAYVSCNGFSDPNGMRKLVRPAGAVWADLLESHDPAIRNKDTVLDKEQLWHETRLQQHEVQRFHLLLMGGDQLYCDSIWQDLPALRAWVSLSRDAQLRFPVGKALERDIDNYYFSLYGARWLPPSRRSWDAAPPNRDCADALARIPTVMMWDDHDIVDGWGSYSPQMQQSPVFRALFRSARRAFWVCQLQHVLADLPALPEPAVAPRDPLFPPVTWSTQLQHDALALPLLDGQPGFSMAFRLGPIALVVPDLRSERSRTQVMGPATWHVLQRWLHALGSAKPACLHLLLMSSVPVVHPKLALAAGLSNLLGGDHVLDSSTDDLKDQWSDDDHEGERKRLLQTLTDLAEAHKIRVAILSGDVHVAAWGIAYRRDIAPVDNWSRIYQFTSSAVVHPSLSGLLDKLFLGYLNNAAGKVQLIDAQHQVEMMRFPGHSQFMMAARNWLAVEVDPASDGKLWFTWRCEQEQGFSNHLQALG
ncbi:hypothetical protein IMCC9480_2161 [Oxalobacteraceae bacterium IMCC9480]|nr:hypothetical protein IMCC9480_2161 [Oxalobacteraceae bacterium IMCC9480]